MLVAAGQPTVVERMQRLEVDGQRHLGFVVLVAVLVDDDARIVRIAERQVHEERSALVVATLEKLDGRVGNLLAGVAGQPFFCVVAQILLVLEILVDAQRPVAVLAVMIRLVTGGSHRAGKRVFVRATEVGFLRDETAIAR